MTTIRLTNSKTRRKEEFVPLDPQNVRLYLCGPTVYDRAHLGNARPVLVFDVLVRLLRHVYGESAVTYVRNFTDVDDKINAEAVRRRDAGAPGTLEDLIAERTEETIAWYHADMDALGAARPDHEPRATAYIPQMVAMIADLIERGHAYAADGHVLFDVRSFPDYGRLSGRSVDDMIAGARVEVAPFKRDPMDFVLWKPSSDDLPGWDSPWGRGRPGWHIECSAMADQILWEDIKDRLSAHARAHPHQIDIHGGGEDLLFPHHENEVAQSCCAHRQPDFARFWLHNEMLHVEGEKMSKSLGNFFTVRDLLEKNVPGEVIRFVMLRTHYGKSMDWTDSKRGEAQTTLRAWRDMFARTLTGINQLFGEHFRPSDAIVAALSDDLNTSDAITDLHKQFSTLRKLAVEQESAVSYSDELVRYAAQFLASAQFLGFLTEELAEWYHNEKAAIDEHSHIVEALYYAWKKLREAQDYEASDFLRSEMENVGIRMATKKNGLPDIHYINPANMPGSVDLSEKFKALYGSWVK